MINGGHERKVCGFGKKVTVAGLVILRKNWAIGLSSEENLNGKEKVKYV